MIKKCQNCKQSFTIEQDDFAFYEKIQVPPPTFCSECRLQRRLAWRNMRSIYKRKCDKCDKTTISIYSQDKPYVVYCATCWWGDKWDAMDYGRDYDFNRGFFEQFDELIHQVPLVSRYGIEPTAVHSDYVNMFKDIKDCYLCFHVDFIERCLYCYYGGYIKDCNALAFSHGSEQCYESMAVQQCNKVFYSKYSESCLDSWFLKNCSGCTNVFASANLRNKQYYIFNEPYANKNAYEEKLKELGFDSTSYSSVQNFKQQAQKHWSKYPSKYVHGLKNVDTTGELVNNSKNSKSAFFVRDGENIKYAMFLVDGANKDSMDWTQYGDNGELMYEIFAGGGGAYNCHFGIFNLTSSDIEYNQFVINSKDCFGNVSIRNKQYCILNKQYTKEEYESLRNKIIAKMKTDGEYGEFFPIAMSPFGYNETTAQEQFPLDQTDAQAKSYKWSDIDALRGKYEPTMQASELADKITDVGDDVLKQIISCDSCGRAYQIVPAELQFHRKLSLPLPRLCIDCRHDELMKWRNPFKLWPRQCMCDLSNHQPHASGSMCPNKFETSYSPESKEIVYCEQCYQAETS